MNPTKYKFLALAILPVSLVMASPVLGDAVCNDGWYSSSSGSGTCSWHGGVAYWVDDIPTWEPPYVAPWEPSPLDDLLFPSTLPPWLDDSLNDTTLPSPGYIFPNTPPTPTTQDINPLTGKPYGANATQQTKTEDWWVWAFWGSIILAFGHILILDIIAEIRKGRQK